MEIAQKNRIIEAQCAIEKASSPRIVRPDFRPVQTNAVLLLERGIFETNVRIRCKATRFG